jgi:trigger factor
LFAIVQPEPGSKVRLRIHVEQKHVDRAYQKLFQDLIDRGNIPGFRKGKVPLWRIRREYGPKAIDGAVYGDLMERALRCVLTYGELPVTRPVEREDEEDEDDGRLAQENQPLESDTLEWYIQPEVRIPPYEGIELTAPETEPTDEEIDNELKRLQDAAADLVEVERKEVQPGDQVEIVMSTRVEGEEGEPEAEDESLIVGEDRYDPPIDTHLLGHSVGETVEFAVDYPDRSGFGRLAGKTVQVTADIKDLRERRVPALDAEFAGKAVEGCESVEALREEVVQRLRREHEELAEQVMREGAIRWLGNNARVDLPQALLDRAERDVAAEDESLAGDTARTLSLVFTCEALLAEKGVEVSEAELRQAYMAFGASRGLDPSLLAGDAMPREVEGLFRDGIVRRKAGEIVAEVATRKVVPLSELEEELRRALEGRAEGSAEPTEEPEDEPTS